MVLVRSRLRPEDTAGLFQATEIDNASTWTGFDGQRRFRCNSANRFREDPRNRHTGGTLLRTLWFTLPFATIQVYFANRSYHRVRYAAKPCQWRRASRTGQSLAGHPDYMKRCYQSLNQSFHFSLLPLSLARPWIFILEIYRHVYRPSAWKASKFRHTLNPMEI